MQAPKSLSGTSKMNETKTEPTIFHQFDHDGISIRIVDYIGLGDRPSYEMKMLISGIWVNCPYEMKEVVLREFFKAYGELRR